MAARKLLKGKHRPTAIVAGRDLHAEGICRLAGELGLVIGRDLSVVGFDDVSWTQEVPFLTTFREPCYELGAVAADMLIDRMTGGWRAPEQREIPAPLILRRSAGTPPDGPPDAAGISVQLQISSASGAELSAAGKRAEEKTE
jgi:DNA-binding LacI/PurR family transcriptional regulator